MDSDSPVVAGITGQPMQLLGTLFKPGNTTFVRRCAAEFVSDVTSPYRGYRESPSIHRSSHGEGL